MPVTWKGAMTTTGRYYDGFHSFSYAWMELVDVTLFIEANDDPETIR